MFSQHYVVGSVCLLISVVAWVLVQLSSVSMCRNSSLKSLCLEIWDPAEFLFVFSQLFFLSFLIDCCGLILIGLLPSVHFLNFTDCVLEIRLYIASCSFCCSVVGAWCWFTLPPWNAASYWSFIAWLLILQANHAFPDCYLKHFQLCTLHALCSMIFYCCCNCHVLTEPCSSCLAYCSCVSSASSPSI